jgi:hypothetical protein
MTPDRASGPPWRPLSQADRVELARLAFDEMLAAVRTADNDKVRRMRRRLREVGVLVILRGLWGRGGQA